VIEHRVPLLARGVFLRMLIGDLGQLGGLRANVRPEGIWCEGCVYEGHGGTLAQLCTRLIPKLLHVIKCSTCCPVHLVLLRTWHILLARQTVYSKCNESQTRYSYHIGSFGVNFGEITMLRFVKISG